MQWRRHSPRMDILCCVLIWVAPKHAVCNGRPAWGLLWCPLGGTIQAAVQGNPPWYQCPEYHSHHILGTYKVTKVCVNCEQSWNLFQGESTGAWLAGTQCTFSQKSGVQEGKKWGYSCQKEALSYNGCFLWLFIYANATPTLIQEVAPPSLVVQSLTYLPSKPMWRIWGRHNRTF